jgi:hypothetical protein
MDSRILVFRPSLSLSTAPRTAHTTLKSSVVGDAVIAIIATVAKQERVRISQRVKAGLETARAKGKRLGRPHVVVDRARIGRLRAQGLSWAKIAAQLGVGEGTVYRQAHEFAKNPIGAAPVSRYAQSSGLSVLLIRQNQVFLGAVSTRGYSLAITTSRSRKIAL